jgi:hypothetical protein
MNALGNFEATAGFGVSNAEAATNVSSDLVFCAYLDAVDSSAAADLLEQVAIRH